jgi:hypothetical protein
MYDVISNSPQSEKSNNSATSPPQHTEHSKLAENFNHYTLGIWHLYVEKPLIRWRVPLYPFIPDKAQFISDLGYLWRAICDLNSPLLFARLAVSAGLALSPAASLWCVVSVA